MVGKLKRLLLCAFALLPACGEDGTLGPVNIGPAGGTIYLDPDSVISITFPPGALSKDLMIQAVAASGPASNLVVPGTVWDVTLSEPETLAIAATVKIRATVVPTGFVASELAIWKVVNGVWTKVPGSGYSVAENAVIAQVTTFSVYGILAEPVGDVQINKPDTTLTQGDAFTVTATVRDSGGTVLPNRTVTFSSTNASIASVNGNSVQGNGVGTTNIIADADGVRDTIAVTVQGATSQVWLEENFLYASTTELLADPRNIYSQNEDSDPVRIFLDPEGMDGVTNSMRYDYPDRTGIGGTGTSGRCTDYTLGRNMTLPQPVQEMWAEFYIKFSSNFLTRAPAAWGCTSNPDLKFVFGRLNGVNDRFIVKVGAGGSEWHAGYPGGPQAEDTYVIPTSQHPMSAYWNNTWFRLRVHFKLSTTASSGDGAMHMWLGNDLVVNGNNLNVQNGGVKPQDIYSIALGRNMNQGPGQVQSVWFGRIRLYNTNPGW